MCVRFRIILRLRWNAGRTGKYSTWLGFFQISGREVTWVEWQVLCKRPIRMPRSAVLPAYSILFTITDIFNTYLCTHGAYSIVFYVILFSTHIQDAYCFSYFLYLRCVWNGRLFHYSRSIQPDSIIWRTINLFKLKFQKKYSKYITSMNIK